MCGICGKFYFEPAGERDLSHLIQFMCDSMSHRGPDDIGFYIGRKIGLGHRRLSIIDLETGKQPITNEDGSVIVVFNGEIYNYESLRNSLKAKGHLFRTKTDTEVIVHSYEEYGEDFLVRLRGMFAIALWDNKNEKLILARDRLGIKPLYFSESSDGIIFSSEIKAILKDAVFGDIKVNTEAIDSFMRLSLVFGKETIFKNIYKLLPGWYIKVQNGNVQEHQYWDLKYGKNYYNISFENLKKSLDSLLRETMRGHMLSDVPVGFLLSGGVDSTALLSYAIQGTKKDISSFTVGFGGENFADERYFARLAADKFGTKHHEITFSSSDFMNFLPGYIYHIEDLVHDPSTIALYFVSKYASNYVKVLLSGEGADEAFAGYPNYRNYLIVNRISKVLGPTRYAASKVIRVLFGNYRKGKYKKYCSVISENLNNYYFSRLSGEYSFINDNYNSLYKDDMIDVHRSNLSYKSFFDTLFEHCQDLNFLNQMLYVDSKTWLPDNVLVKADKMTMANSVELRVPFLDHEVMEFAANIPHEYKVYGTKMKYILKETLRDIVPDEILFRKKTGFPVPYERWLGNELHESAREILLDHKALNRGYFNRDGLERMIKANKSTGLYSKEIWSLLIIEMWHKVFIDSSKDILK